MSRQTTSYDNQERPETMPDYKKLFEQLCMDAGFSEHMGDVTRAVNKALGGAGHDTADLFNDYGDLRTQWFVDNGMTED